MRMIVSKATGIIVCGLALLVPAAAQSLSPMRATVTSVSEHFAVRILPGNPYDRRVQIKIKVYDHNFREIKAVVRPANPFLAAGKRRPVTVIVPFDGRYSRKIRICAESTPYQHENAQLRGQVCGRYFGRRAG